MHIQEKGKRKRSRKKFFEKVMASNFPDLMRITLLYQSKNLNRIYRKIFTPRHMTVEQLKDKHKILKAVVSL